MYITTLTKVKNAIMAGKDTLKVPYSRMDHDVLEALEKAGYLEAIEKKGRSFRRAIAIKLKKVNNSSAISGIKFLSHPSRRLYIGYKDIRRSRQGYGNFFLSTPQGIMKDSDAKKAKVGGEILFEIW